jgi:hypothetical protein
MVKPKVSIYTQEMLDFKELPKEEIIQRAKEKVIALQNDPTRHPDIKLPKQIDGDKNHPLISEQALVLGIFLIFINQIIDKDYVMDIGSKVWGHVRDIQYLRHIKGTYGFRACIWRCRHPETGVVMGKGQYCLVNTTECDPSFNKDRRNVMDAGVFDTVKNGSYNTCYLCGVHEGDINRYGKVAKMEQGHLNPDKELCENNVAPICSDCNQVTKNTLYMIKDKNGFPALTINKVLYPEHFELAKKLGIF